MTAPLADGVTPPELELFETLDKAMARAKELQAKLGGSDKAKIDIIDAPAVFTRPAEVQWPF